MEGYAQKPAQSWWEGDGASGGGFISSSLAISDSCESLNIGQKWKKTKIRISDTEPLLQLQEIHQEPFSLTPFPEFEPQLQVFQHPSYETPVPVVERQPRVRERSKYWTLEHQRRFVDAVNALGGFERATPKTVLKLMDGSGLNRTNIFQVKSTLQIYRSSRAISLSKEISRKNDSFSNKLKDIQRRLQYLVMHSCYSSEQKKGVCVISCGGNRQDAEEKNFVDDMLNELRKRAVMALRYDLVTDTGTRILVKHHTLYGVFVLFFSKDYYTSPQNLDKLVALMEYKKANGLLVIPIFYKVTHSELRDPKGFIEETFLQLDHSVHTERIQKWREAIIELALTDDFKWIAGNESILPEEIVRYLCLRLFSISSQNVTRMYSLLASWQPSAAQVIGLWGMPGVGKAAVAGEIFRRLAPGYDLCYFLQDFHLMYQTKGMSHLRDEFFSKLFGEEKPVIDVCDTKPSFMKDRFQGKTVLVVIDDVSNARDAEDLVGGFDWFSHGHLIILTSRNRQVLIQCKVKRLYNIQKLSQYESSKFLSLCVP